MRIDNEEFTKIYSQYNDIARKIFNLNNVRFLDNVTIGTYVRYACSLADEPTMDNYQKYDKLCTEFGAVLSDNKHYYKIPKNLPLKVVPSEDGLYDLVNNNVRVSLHNSFDMYMEVETTSLGDLVYKVQKDSTNFLSILNAYDQLQYFAELLHVNLENL